MTQQHQEKTEATRTDIGSGRRFGTQAKIQLFQGRFRGRQDVYGSYDPATGRAFQVKEPVTSDVLLEHLRGKRPYGVYLLDGDRTRAVVVDFDDGTSESALRFLSLVERVGIAAYVERSKCKGYHVWIFCGEEPVLASKARAFTLAVLTKMGMPQTEVFPKQDRLTDQASYGNFINAPLFGALVPKSRTVFVEPHGDMKPFPNQWDFLRQVQAATEAQLDEALKLIGGGGGGTRADDSSSKRTGRLHSSGAHFAPRSALPICAQRMLNEGVTDNQRVACFRLAIHFNRLGVPFDITVAALGEWARKNKPTNGKGVITGAEIEKQADWAYKKAYRGFGCDEPAVKPFCSPECPLWWRGPKPVDRKGQGNESMTD